MAAEHATEMFKHMEKQSEVLMDAYRAMSHELHRLQVEEEVLMQKLYGVMQAKGLLNEKKKSDKDSSKDASRSVYEN